MLGQKQKQNTKALQKQEFYHIYTKNILHLSAGKMCYSLTQSQIHLNRALSLLKCGCLGGSPPLIL